MRYVKGLSYIEKDGTTGHIVSGKVRYMKERKSQRWVPWVCWAYLIMSFLVSFVLPPWLAWENQGLEMAQNILLGALACVSLLLWHRTKGKAAHASYLAICGYFLLLLGRELSWGRVFMLKSVGAHGPIFVSMHELMYHTCIEAAIGAYMLVIAWALWRYVQWAVVLERKHFPGHVFAVCCAAAVVAALGDKGFFFNADYSELVEEFAELLVYAIQGYFLYWYVRRTDS